MGVWWHHSVVLIFIFPGDVEHLSMDLYLSLQCIDHSYILGEMSVQIFCSFSDRVICFFLSNCEGSLDILVQILCQVCFANIFTSLFIFLMMQHAHFEKIHWAVYLWFVHFSLCIYLKEPVYFEKINCSLEGNKIIIN